MVFETTQHYATDLQSAPALLLWRSPVYFYWWERVESNHLRINQQIYSLPSFPIEYSPIFINEEGWIRTNVWYNSFTDYPFRPLKHFPIFKNAYKKTTHYIKQSLLTIVCGLNNPIKYVYLRKRTIFNHYFYAAEIRPW